jgi:hypothetical protein
MTHGGRRGCLFSDGQPHASLYDTFNPQPHMIRRPTLRQFRAEAHQTWAVPWGFLWSGGVCSRFLEKCMSLQPASERHDLILRL